MENTRILISENAEGISKIDQAYAKEKKSLLDRANAAMARFSEFDETFSETGSTTAKYSSLLASGAQSFIDGAVNKIKQEFTAAGITSSAVMSVATERTQQNGNEFLKAYNELLQYPELPAHYPELKFSLSDVKFVNGLAAVKAEKDLEGLKDGRARAFIDTQVGYDLVAKAESLVNAMNSLNDFLAAKGLSKATSLEHFREFVDYAYSPDTSTVQLQVNTKGIYHAAKKMEQAVPA